jgi:hypothetical protein
MQSTIIAAIIVTIIVAIYATIPIKSSFREKYGKPLNIKCTHPSKKTHTIYQKHIQWPYTPKESQGNTASAVSAHIAHIGE